MRASRILSTRPERAIIALAQLCEERKETQPAQASPPPAIFIPPRLSSIPPQTPYTVGSNSGPKGLPSPDRIAPDPQLSEPAAKISTLQHVTSRTPPEHMAPKRREWTSPPPRKLHKLIVHHSRTNWVSGWSWRLLRRTHESVKRHTLHRPAIAKS